MKYIDPEDLFIKLNNRYLAINLAAKKARQIIEKLTPKKDKVKESPIFDLEGTTAVNSELTPTTDEPSLSLDSSENIYIAALKEVLKKI
ncbi:MAG: DNA-directed RNA polymerase subunit omega [candidate division WOR-3 bacterium]|nr:DNA-directed RNA polymerase subunit omega [candidate division WOR-3 bacterium]